MGLEINKVTDPHILSSWAPVGAKIVDVSNADLCLGDLYPGAMSGPAPHPGMFVPGPGHPPGFPGPEHWPYPPGPDFGPIPDYQFNNNNDPIKKRRGRKKRKVDEFAAINGYMEVWYGIIIHIFQIRYLISGVHAYAGLRIF